MFSGPERVRNPLILSVYGLGVLAGLLATVRHDDAAVLDVANHVFELDGGVLDAEFRPQPLLDFAQDAFTDGWRNIFNGDMA